MISVLHKSNRRPNSIAYHKEYQLTLYTLVGSNYIYYVHWDTKPNDKVALDMIFWPPRAPTQVLSNPQGLTVDHHGNILVCDTGNNRVCVLRPYVSNHIITVSFIGSIGNLPRRGPKDNEWSRPIDGQLNMPTAVTANPVNDTIVVCDSGNHQIQVFDYSGKFIKRFGQGADPKCIDTVHFNILVKYFESKILSIHNKLIAMKPKGTTLKDVTPNPFAFSRAFKKQLDKDMNDHPFITFFLTILIFPIFIVAVAEVYTFILDLGINVPKFLLKLPIGIIRVLINKLVVNGHTIMLLPVSAVANQIKGPYNKSDSKYVCMLSGTLAGELNAPSSVAIDTNGDIIVCDSGNHRIQIFSSKTYEVLEIIGQRKASIGKTDILPSSRPGRFSFPTNVVVDSKGNIIVADNGNNRIQIFSSDHSDHRLSVLSKQVFNKRVFQGDNTRDEWERCRQGMKRNKFGIQQECDTEYCRTTNFHNLCIPKSLKFNPTSSIKSQETFLKLYNEPIQSLPARSYEQLSEQEKDKWDELYFEETVHIIEGYDKFKLPYCLAIDKSDNLLLLQSLSEQILIISHNIETLEFDVSKKNDRYTTEKKIEYADTNKYISEKLDKYSLEPTISHDAKTKTDEVFYLAPKNGGNKKTHNKKSNKRSNKRSNRRSNRRSNKHSN